MAPAMGSRRAIPLPSTTPDGVKEAQAGAAVLTGPPGLGYHRSGGPTAGAVGYLLPPLRGWRPIPDRLRRAMTVLSGGVGARIPGQSMGAGHATTPDDDAAVAARGGGR